MLSLFRRLRRTLLTNGSITKYLLYALGEIFLVVLGILIALQINNWNERQKNIQLEQQYLIALQEEFTLNQQKLKALDTLLSDQIDAARVFIQNTHPDKVSIDNSRFAHFMGEGFRDTHNYSPSSGVMKDLVNSGKLSLIRNIELRRIIADWDSNIIRLKEVEAESKKASYDVVEILRTEGNFRNQMDGAFKALGTGPSHFNNDNTDLLRLEVFENSVVYFKGTTWRLKHVFYPELSKKMDNVLSLIEEDLE